MLIYNEPEEKGEGQRPSWISICQRNPVFGTPLNLANGFEASRHLSKLRRRTIAYGEQLRPAFQNQPLAIDEHFFKTLFSPIQPLNLKFVNRGCIT